jgi:vitamin B12 transporter
MPYIKPPHSLRALLTALCLVLFIMPCTAWGEDEEETLGLFNAWQETSTASSRAPKPLSQTAENVSVVTRSEIEALNAHTLADVLATIPGVQIAQRGGPGGIAFAFIQSSNFDQILVMVDGVPLNSLGDNFSDVAMVPAGIIERIEIVKGAASSAWGQALGGVINVITKSPEQGRPIGGSASASIGEHTTSDTRAELGGTNGRLGYYLSGGWLGTNGLSPDNLAISSSNAYAKLTYDLPGQGQIWSTFSYNRDRRGVFFLPSPDWDFKENQDIRNLSATLGLRRPLGERLELEILARHSTWNIDTYDALVSTGALFGITKGLSQVSGGSAKLVWRGENNLLVAGGDYEHAELRSTDAFANVDLKNRVLDRWGIFLNDTLTIGRLAIIPGIRFDQTASNGDQFSPSLGVTWQLNNTTLLRGYTAKGFSLPSLDLERPTQKVWTSQIGIESEAVSHLWLKGSLFRNETWNIIDTSNQDITIPERRIALGTELEARTTPVWNTSLGAGYTFTDTTRSNDGSQVFAYPRHTVQLALRYTDQVFRGVLTGRHIWWNADPSFGAKYYGLLWDLHLGATLFKREHTSLELFFSGHNLFNGVQESDSLTPNTSRWFEGGMKVRF